MREQCSPEADVPFELSRISSPSGYMLDRYGSFTRSRDDNMPPVAAAPTTAPSPPFPTASRPYTAAGADDGRRMGIETRVRRPDPPPDVTPSMLEAGDTGPRDWNPSLVTPPDENRLSAPGMPLATRSFSLSSIQYLTTSAPARISPNGHVSPVIAARPLDASPSANPDTPGTSHAGQPGNPASGTSHSNKRQCSLFGYQFSLPGWVEPVSLLGVILALVMMAAQIHSTRLAHATKEYDAWSAKKDYWELCAEMKEKHRQIPSRCEETLKRFPPPPPNARRLFRRAIGLHGTTSSPGISSGADLHIATSAIGAFVTSFFVYKTLLRAAMKLRRMQRNLRTRRSIYIPRSGGEAPKWEGFLQWVGAACVPFLHRRELVFEGSRADRSREESHPWPTEPASSVILPDGAGNISSGLALQNPQARHRRYHPTPPRAKQVAFRNAIRSGDVDAVMQHLSQGADVNDEDPDEASPLGLAASSGFERIVRLLSKQGASVHATGPRGVYPVHLAAENGHHEVVGLLLDRGADINATDSRGWTAMHFAAAHGSLKVLLFLIGRGADVGTADTLGRTAMHNAATHGTLEVLGFLLGRGADMGVTDTDGWTAMHLAAAHGQIQVVELLLGRGADVGATDTDGWTAMHLAAESGHLKVVELLLARGADMGAADDDPRGLTALHQAAGSGHLEVVELLLNRRADIGATDALGGTAMHIAAANGHRQVVELLLGRGADIGATDRGGFTALHLATEHNHYGATQILLSGGADIGATDALGGTAMHIAAADGHLQVVELLLDRGANIGATDRGGFTALHLATKHNHYRAMQILLSGGADIRAINFLGATALHLAAAKNNEEIFRLLLVQGANITATDNEGNTALHVAAANGRHGHVRLLLNRGADISAANADGDLALDLAVESANREMVQLLLEEGADRVTSRAKATALHVAARKGRHEMVQLFLSEGADVNATDRRGYAALHLAAMNGYEEVIEVLVSNGASIDIIDREGCTALHRAAEKGKIQVSKILLGKGAQIEAKNYSHDTPLHVAAQGGYLELVKVLLAHHANIDVVGSCSRTPLHWAALSFGVRMLTLFAEHLGDFRARDINRETPLQLYCRKMLSRNKSRRKIILSLKPVLWACRTRLPRFTPNYLLVPTYGPRVEYPKNEGHGGKGWVEEVQDNENGGETDIHPEGYDGGGDIATDDETQSSGDDGWQEWEGP
ncbi:MAG: hypothetical protein M1823_004584 [Watsoniomyces obsoletus]|nr:MAG: hypothetical protein M1823_004584 [Watsoniomyces obsoletus]